jgi:hypothetical protein
MFVGSERLDLLLESLSSSYLQTRRLSLKFTTLAEKFDPF